MLANREARAALPEDDCPRGGATDYCTLVPSRCSSGALRINRPFVGVGLKDKHIDELRKIADELKATAGMKLSLTEAARLIPAIKSDAPIKSSTQDRLNRTGFAAALANAVINLDVSESIVIGVHGAWGTGKTSLLNLIEEQLQAKAESPPLIMRFNPWDFSDQNQLSLQFFSGLSAFLRLHQTTPALVRIADVVGEYGKLLDPLARLAFPRGAEATALGWSFLKKFRVVRQRTSVELKAQIDGVLRATDTRLVILIDDIDRLHATEIRQVFQLIKLNANFTNTVYVVAFDVELVVDALGGVAPRRTTEYLEKIVQVAFPLPPIGESKLTTLILEKFDETLKWFGVSELDRRGFGNMFYSGFRDQFRTLRDINRFFNLFRFGLAMVGEDTNFTDLAAVEAIALFHPEIHSALEGHPDLFAGASARESEDRGSLQKRYSDIFANVPDDRRDSVVSLCRFLFPKMERAYSRTDYGPEWEKGWEKERRIAASRYFPYYFQLTVPEGEVTRAEMAAALDTATSVETFVETLRTIKGSGRFAAFVDLLRHHVDSLERVKLLTILESIFVHGDDVSTEGTGTFGLVTDHLRFGSWLFLDILDALKEDRFKQLMDRMRAKPAVYTIANTAHMFATMVSKGDEAGRYRQKYPDLTDSVVHEMNAIALEAIRVAAKANRLKTAPNLPFLLFFWKRETDKESITEWIEASFLRDPRGAASFVACFATKISSFGLHDRVESRRTAVSVKDLYEFVDLDRLANLLRATDDAELDEKEREAKKAFMRAKAQVDRGRPLDSVDSMSPPIDDERVT